MNKEIYDSSAVDNYLNEISKREQEVTRSMKIENLRNEVPSQVFKWAGILTAISLLIYVLGNSVANSRSFEQIKINEYRETFSGNPSEGEDELIDIESLLPVELEEIDTSNSEIVRDFYRFDHVPYEGEKIKTVIIGTNYKEQGAPASSRFCYVRINDEGSISKRIDLANISSGERHLTEITDEFAQKIGVTKKELLGAQAKCSI